MKKAMQVTLHWQYGEATPSHPDTFNQKRSDIRHVLKNNWLNLV
jgi:hypothetical protein